MGQSTLDADEVTTGDDCVEGSGGDGEPDSVSLAVAVATTNVAATR